MTGTFSEKSYWQDVHSSVADDLAAVNYPALPASFNRLVDRIFAGPFEDAVDALAPGKGLEIGCGRGRWLRRLARRGWKVTGLDLASPTAGVIGSGSGLPFTSGTFDLATAITVLQHMSSKEEALAELTRVVRPGGHVLLVEVLDRGGVRWQSHVMPKTLTWWRETLRRSSLEIVRDRPVEYLPILRIMERLRGARSSGGSQDSPSVRSGPLKTLAWNAVTLASYPIEPLAAAILPDSASHRLFLCRRV